MTRARGRAIFVGLIALFAAPPLAAWLVHDVAGWHGDGAAAAGELVSPPVRLASRVGALTIDGKTRAGVDVLTGRWTMLQVAPQGCAPPCRASLVVSRQVRALLHSDAPRVQRILLLGDNTRGVAPRPVQPDLAIFRNDLTGWRALLATHHAAAPGTVLLIDPAGRWMARYPPPADADALYHDLTRLLAATGGP